jgi:ferrous iron transport protein A
MHCPSLPLESVPVGDWAEVEEVAGEPNWVGRMAELGLRAGTYIRVLRQGSPCLLQVGGSRLSLRGEANTRILVRPASMAG